MPPGHPIILLKSNLFNMAAVSAKRSIALVRIEQPIVAAEETARIASRGTTPQSVTEIVNYQVRGQQ